MKRKNVFFKAGILLLSLLLVPGLMGCGAISSLMATPILPVTPTPTPIIPTLTPTSTLNISTPSDVAKIVLEKVAKSICYGHPETSSFFETDTTYSFYCSPAGGHFTVASLQWFNNESEARAAFDDRRKGNTVLDFYGFPRSTWSEDHPSFPGGRNEYRIQLWQAHQWLIRVVAFDDTHFIIAPDPGIVSESIYQVGLEHNLFTVGGQ